MTSSVIIAGASGSLGGKIAFKLTEIYPKQDHFVLAVRNTTNESANDLSTLLRSAGATLTWETLDLSSIDGVSAFAVRIHAAVTEKQIPPLYGLVNSAAIQVLPATSTVDGFDLEYQTNTLAPILLIQKLAPLLNNGVVINVSSSTNALGNYGQFKEEHAKLQDSTGDTPSTTALLNKYGSTELILMMAGYALQRHARFTNVQIVEADPGGMCGGSCLAPEGRALLKFFQYLFRAFRPIIKIFFPSAINPPEVPAEAIANLISRASSKSLENFYVLEKPTASSGSSNDSAKQDEALSFVMEDLKKWISLIRWTNIPIA